MKTSFLCSCTQPRNRNTVPPRAKSISGKLHYNDSLICSSSSALARKLLHLSIKNKISKRRETFVLNFLLEQSETGSDTSEICLELQQQPWSPQMSGVPRTPRLLGWKGHLQPARGEWRALIACAAPKPDPVRLLTSSFPVLLLFKLIFIIAYFSTNVSIFFCVKCVSGAQHR